MSCGMSDRGFRSSYKEGVVSELQVLRGAQVVDHWRDALEGGHDERLELVGTGQVVVESLAGGEALALEVVDQFVFGVEAARLAFQAFAPELEMLAESTSARGFLPGAGVVDHEVADVAQRVRLGVPQAAAGETVARGDVHVERGRGDLAAPLVEHARAGERLVRQLVVREARSEGRRVGRE